MQEDAEKRVTQFREAILEQTKTEAEIIAEEMAMFHRAAAIL